MNEVPGKNLQDLGHCEAGFGVIGADNTLSQLEEHYEERKKLVPGGTDSPLEGGTQISL